MVYTCYRSKKAYSMPVWMLAYYKSNKWMYIILYKIIFINYWVIIFFLFLSSYHSVSNLKPSSYRLSKLLNKWPITSRNRSNIFLKQNRSNINDEKGENNWYEQGYRSCNEVGLKIKSNELGRPKRIILHLRSGMIMLSFSSDSLVLEDWCSLIC